MECQNEKKKCTLIMIASASWLCALCHSNCKNFYLFYEQIFLCLRHLCRRQFARIDAYTKLWVKRQKRRTKKKIGERKMEESKTNERTNEWTQKHIEKDECVCFISCNSFIKQQNQHKFQSMRKIIFDCVWFSREITFQRIDEFTI